MRLNITIATSCDLLIVILLPGFFLSLKLKSALKKHVLNTTEIKYGFVRLVVIFYIFLKSKTLRNCLSSSPFLHHFSEIMGNLEQKVFYGPSDS